MEIDPTVRSRMQERLAEANATDSCIGEAAEFTLVFESKMGALVAGSECELDTQLMLMEALRNGGIDN